MGPPALGKHALAWNAANAARIFLSLAKRPRHVPRYLAHNGFDQAIPHATRLAVAVLFGD
jgi:hypothetical protein